MRIHFKGETDAESGWKKICMTVQTKDSRIWYTVPLKMMPESPEGSWTVG